MVKRLVVKMFNQPIEMCIRDRYKIYDVKKKEYVTMKVRYPEEKELDVFETNDEGYLMTPEQLKMGTYRIEEVKAPDLYVQPGYEMALKDGESNIPLNQLSQTGAYEDAKRDFITVSYTHLFGHGLRELRQKVHGRI